MRRVIRSSLSVLSAATVLAATAGAVTIPPNVPVTGPQPNLQNEEQIWICPVDTNVVLTNHRDFRLGYRQIGLGRSTNGGLTWVDSLVRPAYQLFGWQSDPVMTVNSAGEYFICHLDFDPSGADGFSYAVFLKSTNKGATWTGPFTVEPNLGPYFEDKQFVACDRTGGPYAGNVYISWTRFSGNDPTRMMFARSVGGSMIWNDTIVVGPPLTTSCFGAISAGQFSQPLVGKDGAVYVFWQGYDIDSSAGCIWYNAIRVSKSTDGGVTWSKNRLLHRVDGWNSVDGAIDVYSQPTTDADITGGSHAGNLYLQYRDVSATSPFDSDIMFQRSLDTGHTWSPPMRVNDDPVGVDVDQFHNWLVCNDQGILVSIWYDQRTDPAHFKFDVFAAYSYDGGATWTSNHRVSSVSIDPSRLLASQAMAQGDRMVTASADAAATPANALTPMAGKIAEYIGVSAVGDKVVAVWTDTRDGTQDVYSAHWYLPLTDPRLIYPLHSETVDSTAPGLLWATAWKETEDMYRLQISASATFTTVLRDVTVASNTYNDPVTGFGPGVYYWRIKAYRAPSGTPVDSTAFPTPGSFTLATPPCSCPCANDPQCDGKTDVIDVVRTVGVAFRGEPPVTDPACPRARTDVNCSGTTDVVDVVKMADVAFRGANPTTTFCNPCA